MKIWIVNHYAVPPSQTGGTRHHVLARELIRRGHDVTLLASNFNHARRDATRATSGPPWERETADGVPFVWFRTPPYEGNGAARLWNMGVFAARVWRHATRAGLGRPDVIVGSTPHPLAALAAERLARRLGVPFVLEVRDLWPDTLVESSRISARHPLILGFARVERHLYRSARHVVTLLPGAVEHIAARGGHRDRITWVPNGSEIAAVPVPPPNERAPGAPLTFMYAGAHGFLNALDTVLDAAAELERDGWGDRVVLRLLGDGPEKPRLVRRAAEMGLRMVHFDDPVPRGQVAGRLAKADAFLMLLADAKVFRWGVSPNKLFDYLAAARPVIFGVDSPFNPVEGEGAGLSIPPADPAALARAIRAIVELPEEERREMGRRARSYVERHHDLGELARRLEGVLVRAAVAGDAPAAGAAP
jgi:glycosyltransferase involved in cell wall biosynthesis